MHLLCIVVQYQYYVYYVLSRSEAAGALGVV